MPLFPPAAPVCRCLSAFLRRPHQGRERPAIATPIPSLKGTTVVLDSGAKVDAKPEHMVQSAIMGTVYQKKF